MFLLEIDTSTESVYLSYFELIIIAYPNGNKNRTTTLHFSTLLEVPVPFGTIRYVMIRFRTKYPKLNQNVPIRTETYQNISTVTKRNKTYDNLRSRAVYFFPFG